VAADYVLLVDKPAGVTSHDVVAEIRRGLPPKSKVGHAGTLDPFATGLLLILVGRATRTQRFLMVLRKRYEAVARFGAVSSTGDPEGEIIHTDALPDGDLQLPVGKIMQRPPAYSAVKLAGRRAYELARAGERPQLDAREVEIYEFTELSRDRERRAYAIECSAGTYIRSLIADLGDAYCEQLRRTRIGSFDVADADPGRPIALLDALAFLPLVELNARQAAAVAHGQPIEAHLPAGDPTRDQPPSGEPIVRLIHNGELVALARAGPGPSQLRPVVGLR
jgi:tRNA pseudouridine55 synthase